MSEENRIEISRSKDQEAYDITFVYGVWSEDRSLLGRVNPSEEIEGHFVILYQPLDVPIETRGRTVPIGIAHSEDELPEKVYSCAKDCAKQIALARGLRLEDVTEREQRAQTSP